MSGFQSYQPSRLPSALTTLKINDISARHLRFRKFVALFDYIARTEEETCLRKRDDVVLLANKDSDWWLVHNLSSGNKGYVPSSFVAKKGSVEAEEWFMPKLSRKDSERLLLLEGNTQGVFLVRESETSQDYFIYLVLILGSLSSHTFQTVHIVFRQRILKLIMCKMYSINTYSQY
ncbi:Tyrosine-protein kinase Yes [Schistosoma japonicum]|nr:Tyrosine-protein kinase Yes [Schistosoma japonicum]